MSTVNVLHIGRVAVYSSGGLIRGALLKTVSGIAGVVGVAQIRYLNVFY